MTRRWARAVVALAVLGGVAYPSAQSELVIVKEGTGEYHRAACPVVRDGRGVVAMTRAQAEARGYKAHPACDPARPPAGLNLPGTPARSPRAQRPPVFVYVASGDNRYHRENCSRLGADRKKITVDDAAAKKYWPCGACRPPIKKRREPPAIPGRLDRG